MKRSNNKIGARGVYSCIECSALYDKPKKKKSLCVLCNGPIKYFHSTREFKRWNELKFLECCGDIRNLEFQPSFKISINGTFVRNVHMDSAYFEGNERVVEDVKGFMNAAMKDAFDLKMKIVEAMYNVKVRVVK